MLFARPTKHGAGITLYGDYYDLRSMHETVYSLTKGYPLEGRFGDFVVGLAYDLRKAYEGMREAISLPIDGERNVQYFGENILWPVYLPQVGLLLWAASFHCISREDQANIFLLENCAQKALESYDPVAGGAAFEWLKNFNGLWEGFLTQFLWETAFRYTHSAKTGKAIFRNLPRILDSIRPMSPDYVTFKALLEAKAKEMNCGPDELDCIHDDEQVKW